MAPPVELCRHYLSYSHSIMSELTAHNDLMNLARFCIMFHLDRQNASFISCYWDKVWYIFLNCYLKWSKVALPGLKASAGSDSCTEWTVSFIEVHSRFISGGPHKYTRHPLIFKERWAPIRGNKKIIMPIYCHYYRSQCYSCSLSSAPQHRELVW